MSVRARDIHALPANTGDEKVLQATGAAEAQKN